MKISSKFPWEFKHPEYHDQLQKFPKDEGSRWQLILLLIVAYLGFVVWSIKNG